MVVAAGGGRGELLKEPLTQAERQPPRSPESVRATEAEDSI